MAGMEDVRSVTTGDKEDKGEVPAGTAASFYAAQMSVREPYLVRARRLSGLTLPALFRPSGDAGGQDTELPWNSIGAYLITNLAAKVRKSMFPSGRPPMKLTQDRKGQRDLAQMEHDDPDHAQQLKTQIDMGLSRVEQEFVECMDQDGDGARIAVACLKLLCGGNHGLQFYPDGSLRGISLERFVTERDPGGKLLRWAIEDPMNWESLPEDIQRMCAAGGYHVDANQAQKPEVKVYTYGRMIGGQWVVHQEAYGQTVPESNATYNDDALPYLFLPWLLLEGEHYGRSYAELYEADLDLVEGFTKTIAEGSAAIARFILLVSPTGLTSKKQVAEALNGDVISGRADDVHALTSEKNADFQTADNVLQQTMQRLARAFLVTSAVVRDAERVTAEEVYRVSQELEEVLGGVYSEQVVTFQIPYCTKKLRYLMREQRVTPLPMKDIQLKVVGGAAALGRNAEMIALDQYIGGALQTLGPQLVLQAINPREYMARRAAALGIETNGLIYTEEQAAQQAQSTQMSEMMKTLGPQMVSAYGQYQTGTQVAETNAAAKLATAGGSPTPAPTVQ